MSIFKRVKKLEELVELNEKWVKIYKENMEGWSKRIGPRYHEGSISSLIAEILNHLDIEPGLRPIKHKNDQ